MHAGLEETNLCMFHEFGNSILIVCRRILFFILVKIFLIWASSHFCVFFVEIRDYNIFKSNSLLLFSILNFSLDKSTRVAKRERFFLCWKILFEYFLCFVTTFFTEYSAVFWPNHYHTIIHIIIHERSFRILILNSQRFFPQFWTWHGFLKLSLSRKNEKIVSKAAT